MSTGIQDTDRFVRLHGERVVARRQAEESSFKVLRRHHNLHDLPPKTQDRVDRRRQPSPRHLRPQIW